MDVYEELVRLRRLGQKCALATIVEVRGSIPSYESAKLLVREDGSIVGTIGGGCVEAEVWNAAREAMETEKPKHLSFNLGQDAAYDNGLICGGQLDIFVEPVLPVPRAFIFGAGHISKSLSKVASLAGFDTVVIDNRDTFANRERFPEAAEVYAAEYEEVFPRLEVNETSYLIIVTRGHRDDMRVLRWAVATQARYIAMIGSKRKVIGVIRELEKEGMPARGVRAHSRAHGAGDRRRHSGGDRRFRGGGDDRRAAQPGVELARAFEVRVRPGIPPRAARQVKPAGLILAAGQSQPHGFPQGAARVSRRDVSGPPDPPLLRVLLAGGRGAGGGGGAHPRRTAGGGRRAAGGEPGVAAWGRSPPCNAACARSGRRTTCCSRWWIVPAVTAATLEKLLAAPPAPLRIPRFNGRRGHPVLFAAALVPEFLALGPRESARDVVNRHPAEYVDTDDEGVIRDIDDPEAYRQLEGGARA